MKLYPRTPIVSSQTITREKIMPWALAGFIIAIVVCILLIAFSSQATPRENALLSVVLAAASIIATWIVAQFYADKVHQGAIEDVQVFHRSNLRMYALKAAEKVNNLSNELQRLAAYLEEELTEPESENVAEVLRSRNERLWSTVHIIHTLKSVNDTALSDWQGVIGDELQEQRQAQLAREETFRDYFARLEGLIEEKATDHDLSAEESRRLSSEIALLRRDLRVGSLRGPTQLSLLRPPISAAKRQVDTSCPVCGARIVYDQKQKKSSIKRIHCPGCSSELFSIWEPREGFQLRARQSSAEEFLCPVCRKPQTANVDNYPGSGVEVACSGCGADVKVARTRTGLRVVRPRPAPVESPPPPISPEVLLAVKAQLPSQPWPVGVHRQIADTLGIGPSMVWRAIGELIRQGVFRPQRDGAILVGDGEDGASAPEKINPPSEGMS